MNLDDDRNKLELLNFSLRVLEEDEYSTLKFFDCGDDDLNDFFINESIEYKKELMSENYCFEYRKNKIALLSFSNDSLELSKSQRKEILPFGKRHHDSIPGVKIGRLGVIKEYHRKGIGTLVLDLCKYYFTNKNRTGCRLLTVDAYNLSEIIDFYQKNDFKFLHENDKDDKTRIMYCDLKPYKKSFLISPPN